MSPTISRINSNYNRGCFMGNVLHDYINILLSEIFEYNNLKINPIF